MRFGGNGTIRRLVLCGAALAMAQGLPDAMARSRHHAKHHRAPRHAAPSKAGTGHSAKAAGKPSKAAAPTTDTAGKLELVPGPIPLPVPATPAVASASAMPRPPPEAKGAIATAVAKLFVGEPVYGAKGEQIGRLSQIMTGPAGQVRSAVISWGGLFGYFQSSRTIAWPEAGPSVQNGKLVLRKMTKGELLGGASPRPEASR